MSAQAELRLVWVDMEMTGLDPKSDAILEIAAVVTGSDLVPLMEIERVISAPEEFLEQMSNRVRRMHTENGLLEAVRTRGIPLRQAEREVVSAVASVCPAGEGLLAGNSVYHDWRFMQRHMPILDQHLHFRHVDIGTISALLNAWLPELEYPPRAEVNHRAMSDVQASLDELRYYCKNALHVDLAKPPTRPR